MWRLDLLSFFLGIGLGLLSGAAFFFWLWPQLEREGAQLWARWRRTYEWVQSSAEGRYRAELAQRLAKHHGLAQVGDLAQLFVPPRLAVPALEADAEATPELGPRQLYWLWPELAGRSAAPLPAVLSLSQLWRDGRRVLLSAAAGAGKSTLLAYTGYVCARGEVVELSSYFPVWVHAADIAYHGWPEGAAGLLAALPVSSGRMANVLGEILAHKLAAGQALLLLDGADEMPASEYPRLADWLQALLRLFPDTRVLAAGPTQGYAPLLLPGFVLSGLMPWRGNQAHLLGQRWAATNGQPEPTVAHFWSPGQLSWQTALRLASVSQTVETEGTPGRWIDRLEAALQRRLPTADRDPAWLAPAARELWQEMAWRCLSQSHGALPLEDVLALMETVCVRYQVSERGAARQLLEISRKSGLFAGIEGKLWRVLSPVWRDFLAAAHLAQTQPPSRIQPHIHDAHWAGVIQFYVARVGMGALIDQLLHNNDTDPLQDGLFEAAAWMPEDKETGEWRRQILLRLGRLIVQPKVPAALRQRAVLALAQTEESGVVTLLRQLLQRPDALVRQAAVAALPILGASSALDLLSQSLADESVDVRRGVVAALGWLHHPAADKLVLRILSGEDEQLFAAAAEVIGLSGGAGAAVLKEAAVDDDPHLRRAAVFGLALVEEPWAYALLQRLQKDDQWLVQSVAGIAVEFQQGKGGAARWWQPSLPGDQTWLIEWATAQGRGVPGGAAGLPVLLQAMQPAQPQGVRLAAITCAAQMVELEVVPALQAVLEDTAPLVREAAFQALCQLSRAHGRWVGQTHSLE